MGLFNLLSRVEKIFEANSNDALDHMEDAAKMTKQAVQDLKDKLQKALDAEVKLKTLVIDKRTNAEKKQQEADQWAHKAEQILDRVDSKQISAEDGDRLAKEALSQQKLAQAAADHYKQEAQAQQQVLDGMDAKVRELHDLIDESASQAEELQMREESAEAAKDISKELSNVGVGNTRELIERMRHKTEESEHMAQAYVELDKANKSTKDEINELLSKTPAADDDSLAALKARRANKNNNNA